MADLKANNGGPAFPSDATENEYASVGMSLRDYFAAKAMLFFSSDSGLMAIVDSAKAAKVTPESAAAKAAYEIADAMLAERDK